MDMNSYINEIKLELTGYILDLELPDDTLELVVNKAFREVQRYIDSTEMITVPYASCIDLTESNVSSVSRIFRSEGFYASDVNSAGQTQVDPMYAMQWQILTGGGASTYNLSNWVSNYSAYNQVLQVYNSMSTDMSFKQDMQKKKLYVNCNGDKPKYITIEYVPTFNSVEEILSDYWIDIIVRMSISLTKVTLGRIRSRYTQTNALWTQDGDKLLEEGNAELADMREKLRTNSQIIYPID